MKDIEAVLLTHIHADHVGFAERLRRETGAAVFVHQDDLAVARAIPRLPPIGFFMNAWRPFVARWVLANGMAAGAYKTEDIGKAQAFRSGQRLDVPGRPTVIHCPGHTAGECMFFLEDRATLISGDALVTLDMLTGRNTGPRVPYKYLNDDDRQARASVQRLRDIGRFIMLPGHGNPWEGSVEELVPALGS